MNFKIKCFDWSEYLTAQPCAGSIAYHFFVSIFHFFFFVTFSIEFELEYDEKSLEIQRE